MKNLELLPINSELKAKIEFGAQQYQKFAHLRIEIIRLEGLQLYVRAEQLSLANGRMLTLSEIHDRVMDLFKEVPGLSVYVSPTYFSRDDIDAVDATWFALQCERYGLKMRRISTHTGIDEATLSQLRNGIKPMTKWHKVALYYYFKFFNLVYAQQPE